MTPSLDSVVDAQAHSDRHPATSSSLGTGSAYEAPSARVAGGAEWPAGEIDRPRRWWDHEETPHPTHVGHQTERFLSVHHLITPEDTTMAKALLGYLSSTDPRVVAQLTAENRRLRQHNADLEAHVLRLQTENDSLTADLHTESLRRLEESMQPV